MAATDRIEAAAKIIADQAKLNASFSKRIPAAIHVNVLDDDHAEIVANGFEARNAAPIEYGERHPLWGNRDYWYPTPHRPFMERALAQKANAAAQEASKVVDDLAADEGYTVR